MKTLFKLLQSFRYLYLTCLLCISVGLPTLPNVHFAFRDINAPPSNITLTPTSIAENLPADTEVGTFTSTDPDVEPSFTYQLVSGSGSADNGSFKITGDKLIALISFNYEAKSSYTIRVRSTDGAGEFREEAFTISITNVNENPVAVNDAYTVAEGGTLTRSAPGVLGNDSDPESASLSASKVTDPANGTLTLNNNGSFTYVHNGSEPASDAFTYRAFDGTNYSNNATVNITITPVNDPPEATNVNINPADQRIGIINTGSFTFFDPDGDAQGAHQYKWYRASNSSGSDAVAITGATGIAYRPVKADGAKYICFEVTPVDEHGLAGTAVKSTFKYINNSPTASNALITAPGTQPGQTVSGSFTYFDTEGNAQGTAIYQWYRKSTSAFTPSSPGTPVGTESTYRLKNGDAGQYIWFKVKPVALAGSTPGDSTWSNIIGPIGAFSASISGSASFCTGITMPITLTINGGVNPYTATLRRTGSSQNKDTTINNITGSPYIINVRIPGTYTLLSLTDKDGDPASVTGTSVVLQYFPRITATFAGADEICNDGSSTAQLTLDFSAGTQPWTFVVSRLRPNRTLINDTTYSNVTTDPFTFSGRVFPPYTRSFFRIRSLTDDNGCPGDTTGTGMLSVSYKPSPTAEISGIDSICPGETADLLITLTGTGPWDITYRRNNGSLRYVNNIGNPGDNYLEYTLHVTQTGSYTLSRVEDAICTGKTSGEGIVRAYSTPSAFISGSATICEHSSTNLTVTLTGAAPWKFSYRRNSDATIEVPNVMSTPRSVSVNLAGTYTLVEVFDKYCQGTVSGSATITISPAPDVSISGLAPAYNKSQTVPVPLTGTPSGGTFTGPGVVLSEPNWYFIPNWAPVGTHNIVYRYRSSPSSCYGYDTAVVRVLEASATIEFEDGRTKYCRNDDPFTVTGVNLVHDIGTFTISGGVGLVDHHDNTATINPAILNIGDYIITYTYFDGTPLSVTRTISIGKAPVADFKWESECYQAGQSISFINTSTSTFGNLTDTSFYWKVYSSTGYTSYTTRDITHTFPQAGNYDIELQLINTYGCRDKTESVVFGLRPTISLAGENYAENFETSPLSWRSGTSSTTTVNSWLLGDPPKGFTEPSSGTKCWYTYIPTYPAPHEESWVTSPCFDFTDVEKPMLKLDIWRLFNSTRDGANIQASADSGKTWMLIGQLDDGINWFNSYNISGNPGGSPIGWSNEGGTHNDTYWVEARHALDMLKGKTKVQFRIAYGSDLNAVGTNGIAFDDFWIGQRNRTSLLEHFTNSSDNDCATANTQLNTMVNGNELNFIDLQYHTSFPGPDPFYQDNPSVPNARTFYYGISGVPYTILNGGSKSQHRFDYDARPLNQNTALVESLFDSKFHINLNSSYKDNSVTVDAQITSMEDIPTTELTIHIAVIERVVTGVTGANGETIFESVVRAMLPDAAGTTIYQSWNEGEYRDIKHSWNMQNYKNANELRVVAFIQNESTNEVFQAALDTIGTPLGIDDHIHGSDPAKSFIVFPNPAAQQAYILFDEETREDITVELYNNVGRLLQVNHVSRGTSRAEIPVDSYPNGIYLVRLVNNEQLIGFSKLTISK